MTKKTQFANDGIARNVLVTEGLVKKGGVIPTSQAVAAARPAPPPPQKPKTNQ